MSSQQAIPRSTPDPPPKRHSAFQSSYGPGNGVAGAIHDRLVPDGEGTFSSNSPAGMALLV